MALFEGTRDDAITAGLDLDGIHFDVHRWYVRQPANTTDEGGGGSDDPPAAPAADGAVDLCYGRHGSVGLESIGFCLACMGAAAGGGREGQAGEEEAAEGDFYALVTYDYPFTSARVIPDLVAFMRDHGSFFCSSFLPFFPPPIAIPCQWMWIDGVRLLPHPRIG